MLPHKQMWQAIYDLADRHGYSASGLAVAAGLDPTALNPSKRYGPSGRPRWPTTETVYLVLQVTGEKPETFLRRSRRKR